MNQATQGSEQKLPATWQTGARHGRRCGHTALLQLGGKLSLLKQGPAAAHPRQKSGTIGLSIPVADEKNQASAPRSLTAAKSHSLWLTTLHPPPAKYKCSRHQYTTTTGCIQGRQAELATKQPGTTPARVENHAHASQHHHNTCKQAACLYLNNAS